MYPWGSSDCIGPPFPLFHTRIPFTVSLYLCQPLSSWKLLFLKFPPIFEGREHVCIRLCVIISPSSYMVSLRSPVASTYLWIEQIAVHTALIILYMTQESRIQVVEILLNLEQVNVGTCWLIQQRVRSEWLQARQTPGGPVRNRSLGSDVLSPLASLSAHEPEGQREFMLLGPYRVDGMNQRKMRIDEDRIGGGLAEVLDFPQSPRLWAPW